MAKKKTVIKWQKKEKIGHSFTTVRNTHNVSPGLNAVTSWLDTSKPSEVLEDLRDYQEDWCDHLYEAKAVIRIADRIKTISFCVECSRPHISSRVATSG